jgi:hypothetical protein
VFFRDFPAGSLNLQSFTVDIPQEKAESPETLSRAAFMFRPVLAIAVGVSTIAVAYQTLRAQEPRVRRVPSLSQRLEQFRQDILGGGDDEPEEQPQHKPASNKPKPNKQTTAPPRATPHRSPFTKPGGEQLIERTPNESNAVRPEYQVARRAQPQVEDESTDEPTGEVQTPKVADAAKAKPPTVAKGVQAENNSPKSAIIDNPLARTARLVRT